MKHKLINLNTFDLGRYFKLENCGPGLMLAQPHDDIVLSIDGDRCANLIYVDAETLKPKQWDTLAQAHASDEIGPFDVTDKTMITIYKLTEVEMFS